MNGRNLFKFFLLYAFAWFISGCYVTRQVYHQGKRLLNRRQVSEVVSDPSVDGKLKHQIKQVESILAFAEAQGLEVEGAYTKIIITDEDAVSYLVQAAYPDKLESYTWWFPIVGRVPYLGFFSRGERDRKAIDLSKKGLDIYLSDVSAFSSLGWFEDPLFSSMLNRNIASLSDLFFHELTHRTLWISGAAAFNEQLASFIARKLTLRYLAQKGLNKEIQKYLTWHEDKKLYNNWLRNLIRELKDLYKNKNKASKEVILKAKEEIFTKYTSELRPAFKVADFIGKETWNNATVLAASLYSPDFERFEKSFLCSGAITAGEYLQRIDDDCKVDCHPDQVIDGFCNRQ